MQNNSNEAAETKTTEGEGSFDTAHFPAPQSSRTFSGWNKSLLLYSSLKLEVACTP
jgi:hypothetical protein